MIIGYSWDMALDTCNYFSCWAISCPFTSLTAQKMKMSKKMKKTAGNVIILCKCTNTHDHRLYSSWDMACDGCNCSSFWAIFCPFTPLTAWKMKISKKWRKTLEISSFYTSDAKNHDHMLYCSWDMACGRCNFYFSFWDIFCPFNP